MRWTNRVIKKRYKCDVALNIYAHSVRLGKTKVALKKVKLLQLQSIQSDRLAFHTATSYRGSQFRLLLLQYSLTLSSSRYLNKNSILLWKERNGNHSPVGKLLKSVSISAEQWILEGSVGSLEFKGSSGLYTFLRGSWGLVWGSAEPVPERSLNDSVHWSDSYSRGCALFLMGYEIISWEGCMSPCAGSMVNSKVQVCLRRVLITLSCSCEDPDKVLKR